MKGKRFQILLPEDLQAEAVFGGGSETELLLPIGGLVFRKTWMYPKISSGENEFVSKLFKMVRC